MPEQETNDIELVHLICDGVEVYTPNSSNDVENNIRMANVSGQATNTVTALLISLVTSLLTDPNLDALVIDIHKQRVCHTANERGMAEMSQPDSR